MLSATNRNGEIFPLYNIESKGTQHCITSSATVSTLVPYSQGSPPSVRLLRPNVQGVGPFLLAPPFSSNSRAPRWRYLQRCGFARILKIDRIIQLPISTSTLFGSSHTDLLMSLGSRLGRSVGSYPRDSDGQPLTHFPERLESPCVPGRYIYKRATRNGFSISTCDFASD